MNMSVISKIKGSAFCLHLRFIKTGGVRYCYSVLFNFRHFPWSVAKRLPFVFYKDAYAKIRNKGRIVLTDSFIKGDKHVIVGKSRKDFDYQCEKTYIDIEGTLTTNGDVLIKRGVRIQVLGTMYISDKVVINSRVRIRSYNSVTIGYNSRISHESQIFDTSFHPMEYVSNHQHNPISAPIMIGDNCWIGNRTTISKGTILSDYTTVASNSLVTKDYSDLPPYSLIGGIPAKLLKSDYSRVWDPKRDDEYMRSEFEWYRTRHKR